MELSFLGVGSSERWCSTHVLWPFFEFFFLISHVCGRSRWNNPKFVSSLFSSVLCVIVDTMILSPDSSVHSVAQLPESSTHLADITMTSSPGQKEPALNLGTRMPAHFSLFPTFLRNKTGESFARCFLLFLLFASRARSYYVEKVLLLINIREKLYRSHPLLCFNLHFTFKIAILIGVYFCCRI